MPQPVSAGGEADALIVDDVAFGIEVRSVEQFGLAHPADLARMAWGEFDMAEDSAEGDVGRIGKPGVAPHGDAPFVLDRADFLLRRPVERLGDVHARDFRPEAVGDRLDGDGHGVTLPFEFGESHSLLTNCAN